MRKPAVVTVVLGTERAVVDKGLIYVVVVCLVTVGK